MNPTPVLHLTPRTPESDQGPKKAIDKSQVDVYWSQDREYYYYYRITINLNSEYKQNNVTVTYCILITT